MGYERQGGALGPIRGALFGPIWVPFGAPVVWGPFGLFWAHLAHLGPIWAHFCLGPILGPFRNSSDHANA